MLVIDKLNVSTKDGEKKILNDFSLTINDGEVHAVMGPNGVGKSTLSKVIMGNDNYIIMSGSIKYNDVELTQLTTDEIAKSGIYLLMQEAPVIEGVSNSEALRTALRERDSEDANLYTFITKINKEIAKLSLPKDSLHRFINKGMSGGEKKKNEVLGLKMLKPSFIILDELDSGLDVDSLKVVANNINEYLEENKQTSVLIITHYSRILDLIRPTYVHKMASGKIVSSGDISLAKEIVDFAEISKLFFSDNLRIIFSISYLPNTNLDISSSEFKIELIA